MRLSRLEIFGFKSFAKKLDLKLLGGITSVVGPNGCGKTNVIDAIRWVLGEQRPTKIRLENMGDVIFKGSNTRHPLGMAEVSLTIENQHGILPVDLPEVTITRRLYRSGESEYLINRKPCRLSDINDLFMDTGMGSDSYSMFEQGMINAILSDKTEDRRHIFEEAAGITKYKARRKSALNTLVGIEGDLTRLHDIVTELTGRVDSLKRQASKASRYKNLKSEIEAKTLALGAFEIVRQKEKLLTVHEALNAIGSDAAAARASIESGAAEVETLTADMNTLEQYLAALAGQYESVIRSIAERDNESARIESRLESLGEMIERSREGARRNTITLERLAEEHGARAEEQSTIQARFEEIERAHNRAAESHRVRALRYAERLAVAKNIEQDVRTKERAVESGTAKLANLAARRADDEKRLSDIEIRARELASTLASIEQELAGEARRKADLDVAVEKISSQRTLLEGKLKDRLAEHDAALTERTRAAERRAAAAAEFEFMDRLISSFDGYGDGVRNAAQASCLAGKVHGVLADLVSADEEYLPAIEASLASMMQYLVVDSGEAAREGARYLAGEPRGRAAFIPLTCSGKTVQIHIQNEPGIIGPAARFVRTAERFQPLVDRLLANVYLVRSLEFAASLREQYPESRFATLHGEFIGAAGDIHSGSAAHDGRSLTVGRIEKRDRLARALEEATVVLETATRRISILDDNCTFLRNALAESGRELDATRDKLAVVSSSVARLTARREGTAETIARLAAERQNLLLSQEAGIRERDATVKEIEAAREMLAAAEKKSRELKRETDELAGDIEANRQELNLFDIERAACREKLAAFRHELESIEERRESLARAAKRAQEEIERAEVEILALGERRQTIAESMKEFTGAREVHERERAAKSTTLTRLRTLRREKEDVLQKRRLALVEVANRESALKLERDEATMIMENIVQRLTEEFFITPDDIPQGVSDPAFEPDREKETLSELRKRLHSIGDVNLAAEEDYSRENERLRFLENEYNDLTEARDTLMETITRLNKIAISRFRETFDRIRENFQITFKQFFEGGVCDLEMAEEEDPLEATISIIARPPGKNVRSISLLSSGERALTAISLLFAIYMVKPSPFCILDEVDAPLDDANIDRFLEVIAKFSERTQFIMVTHNKKTMSRAHNLYGITMEEPGLSSLVSVRLSEVNTYKDSSNTVGASG
jgi:chromosome segregation protein